MPNITPCLECGEPITDAWEDVYCSEQCWQRHDDLSLPAFWVVVKCDVHSHKCYPLPSLHRTHQEALAALMHETQEARRLKRPLTYSCGRLTFPPQEESGYRQKG